MPSPILKKVLLFLLAALFFWLLARFLLPIAMPFLLAALLALAAEPLVSFFQKKTRLSRSLATGIGVTLTLGVLALVTMVLGALLLRQLQALVNVVPDLQGTAQDGLSSLQSWLLRLAQATPSAIRPLATQGVENLFSDGNALVEKLSGWALGLASNVVSKLPDSAFGIGTWLLAGYMLSAKLPAIYAWLKKQLPPSWHQQTKPALRRLKKTVFGWLSAQMKLIFVTFAVLCGGFYLLHIPHWIVWAAAISLLDALPILGTGMVLVPWSIVCLTQGQTARAVGLLGVFAAAALLRSILEPKLVGKQLGLDPLITLVAMYTGYRLWGFGGLIFAPLLTVTAMQVLQLQKER